MKILVTLLSIPLLMLAGCTTKAGIDTSVEAGFSILSKEVESMDERWILKATGATNSAIFEIKGNIGAKSVKVWLDHYVEGKHENDTGYMESGFDGAESLRNLYFNTFSFSSGPQGNQHAVFAVRGEHGISTSRIELTPKISGSSAFTALSAKNIEPGQTVDLALLVFSGNSGGGVSISDTAGTIRDNDEVYVLRCRFD